MSLLLDAGALVAVERGDQDVTTRIKLELRRGRRPLTHGGVVAKVWRGGSGRQARLARLLAGIVVAPIDEALARRTGVLLRDTRTADVIDAALICLTDDGDVVLTSDPNDLHELSAAWGTHIELVVV